MGLGYRGKTAEGTEITEGLEIGLRPGLDSGYGEEGLGA